MSFEQPKPDCKKYSDLISEIQKAIIKILFQEAVVLIQKWLMVRKKLSNAQ